MNHGKQVRDGGGYSSSKESILVFGGKKRRNDRGRWVSVVHLLVNLAVTTTGVDSKLVSCQASCLLDNKQKRYPNTPSTPLPQMMRGRPMCCAAGALSFSAVIHALPCLDSHSADDSGSSCLGTLSVNPRASGFVLVLLLWVSHSSQQTRRVSDLVDRRRGALGRHYNVWMGAGTGSKCLRESNKIHGV